MKAPAVPLPALATAASALALAACLAPLPGNAPPECAETSDCNAAAGEVCDEGVCWGDPPGGTFAVVVGPPAERPDLASTEITVVSITQDGWMDPLTVAPAVMLRGRIEAACEGCRDGVSIPATVHVRRASRIPGGREFLATVTSASDAVGDSFALAVPAIGPDDPPYQVTIEPSAAEPLSPGGPTPAELVPPLRVTVDADDLARGLDLVLAADELRVVAGRVVDGVGAGLPGMRVSAQGRIDPLRPLERVSTIATTDEDGWFVLALGSDVLDVVDLVAVPPAGTVAPTLVARDRLTTSVEPIVLQMPVYPGAATVTVPVRAIDPSGMDVPIDGARVELTTVVSDVAGGSSVEAVFRVEGATVGGMFTADVIAGGAALPRPYLARITPPADSFAASHVSTIAVSAQPGVLATITLDQRVSVTGAVLDATGAPVDGLTVTAKPSLFYLWTLDREVQDLLDDRAPPSAVTNPDGTFTVWVDPATTAEPETIADAAPAVYDLECVPAEESRVPRWTVPSVAPDTRADLGVIRLPDGAAVRARVVDAGGAPIAGAKVQVYEVVTDAGACVAENAPTDCQLPAVLRASAHSRDDGMVGLVLPR